MKKDYDVIVIGAGSAGCAVAYRLAKESQLDVLLLEAGSADKSMMIHMPMGFAFLSAATGHLSLVFTLGLLDDDWRAALL